MGDTAATNGHHSWEAAPGRRHHSWGTAERPLDGVHRPGVVYQPVVTRALRMGIEAEADRGDQFDWVTAPWLLSVPGLHAHPRDAISNRYTLHVP